MSISNVISFYKSSILRRGLFSVSMEINLYHSRVLKKFCEMINILNYFVKVHNTEVIELNYRKKKANTFVIDFTFNAFNALQRSTFVLLLRLCDLESTPAGVPWCRPRPPSMTPLRRVDVVFVSIRQTRDWL